MKKKKVYVWDFDATFFYTPTPEIGKKIWLEKKGEEYPHKGWWSKRETLDIDVFDIPMNEWIYNEYKSSQSDDSVHYLVTGRVKPLEEQVKRIIDKNNLKFEAIYCNDSSPDTYTFKTAKFEELVERHDAEELYIYDDRDTHLPKWVNDWSVGKPYKITIIDSVNRIKLM